MTNIPHAFQRKYRDHEKVLYKNCPTAASIGINLNLQFFTLVSYISKGVCFVSTLRGYAIRISEFSWCFPWFYQGKDKTNGQLSGPGPLCGTYYQKHIYSRFAPFPVILNSHQQDLLGDLHLPPLLGIYRGSWTKPAPSFCEEIVIGRVARATKRVKVTVVAGGLRRESGRFVSMIIRLPLFCKIKRCKYIYGNFWGIVLVFCALFGLVMQWHLCVGCFFWIGVKQ